MSEQLIRYSWVAGELSPALHFRGDLEKYDLGLALCRNAYIDYRGGVSSRGGMEFGDFIPNDGKGVKAIPFTFASNIENTYVLLFSHLKLRFIQDGGYILESNIVITDVTQGPIAQVTTSGAHGYTTGDWVFISGVVGMTEVNNRTFEITVTSATTFELALAADSVAVDSGGYTAYASGGTVARVYTVTSPYDGDDLDELEYTQEKDVVYLTHSGYARYKLVRSAATSWTLSQLITGSSATAPGAPTLTPSAAGTAGVAFCVTAVVDGVESRPSLPTINELSVNYAVTAGHMEVTWTAVSGAQYYNVYRTLVQATGAQLTLAEQFGFVGRAFAPRFVDNNIIPDFTRSFPTGFDPFAVSTVESIDITAPGSSYTKAATVAVAGGGGSGFQGWAIVDGSGEVIGVRIISGGRGYSTPVVTFTDGSGTGATATANLGATTGLNPRASGKFQQRLLYAGSDGDPLGIVGSRPGEFENFDISVPVIASDAYFYSIDSPQNDPIRHMTALKGGMLLFSRQGVWKLGGREGSPVTALDAAVDAEVYNGVSNVRPIVIDTDVLYTQEKGASVRRLTFNGFSNSFSSEDLSTLSNHFFAKGREITAWCYAEDPAQVLWCARSDGTFLSLTYVKDQNVTGWALHTTRGKVEDCVLIEENSEDIVYWVVRRYIGGRWVRMFERMPVRRFNHVEEAWTLDSALRTAPSYPAAEISISAAEGTGVTITADASVFAADDVGKMLRAAGGLMQIASYVSGTEITVDFWREIEIIEPELENTAPIVVEANSWNILPLVTEVSGLWHLEGETVTALADGNVVNNLEIVNGTVTLPSAASMILVGYKFKSRGKTLPITHPAGVIEGRRVRVIGTAIAWLDSRGVQVGAEEGRLYSVRERSTEQWGDPTNLLSRTNYQPIETNWREGNSVYWEQNEPLPYTILGLVTDIEVGDDKD